jgi:hypothetical protein
MKQETLEEAAENYGWKIKRNPFSDRVKANELADSAKQDFIAGAKWQQETYGIMKDKFELQFEDNEYYLVNGNTNDTVATTDKVLLKEYDGYMKKLSKENCDEIFGYIQQPTEIEVEIRCYIGNGDKESNSFKDPLVTNTGIPKLDENNCLILRKL